MHASNARKVPNIPTAGTTQNSRLFLRLGPLPRATTNPTADTFGRAGSQGLAVDGAKRWRRLLHVHLAAARRWGGFSPATTAVAAAAANTPATATAAATANSFSSSTYGRSDVG